MHLKKNHFGNIKNMSDQYNYEMTHNSISAVVPTLRPRGPTLKVIYVAR